MSCEKYSNEYNLFIDKRKKYNDKLLSVYNENNNLLEKIIDFPKYVPNDSLKKFLIRYELVKLIKNIPGDIIECGVCGGRGLFSLLQSHLLLEPNFLYRKVIGFDTFNGFTSISKNDINCGENDFKFENINELEELGKIHTEFYYDDNINKIKLIKGDACTTIPQFIEDNKHILISLLYLDFDLYEPTKTALKNFIPRMPKGAIIAFDEIHFNRFPGETIAMLECLNINNYSIKNILDSQVNYIIL